MKFQYSKKIFLLTYFSFRSVSLLSHIDETNITSTVEILPFWYITAMAVTPHMLQRARIGIGTLSTWSVYIPVQFIFLSQPK